MTNDIAAKHFASDTADAKMTVQREDGLFRHLEFAAQRGMTRIVLVTWPYNLLVAGSHGSFHFERYGADTEDMFNWLRGSRVSPGSWASKLVNGRDSVRKYDRSLLEKEVNERVAEAIRDGWAPKGLKVAVREAILGSDWLDEEQTALRIVNEFEHGTTYRSECSCGKGADHDSYSAAVCWNALTHKGSGDEHKVSIRETGGFDFDETYDWHIHKLDYHYEWACHSAVWGIDLYDAARKSAEVAA